MVERATPIFSALVRHRAGGDGARQNPPSPLPVGGRSLHSDPWREGHRTDEKAGVGDSAGHCRIGRNVRHRGCRFRLNFGRRTSIRRAGHRPETVTHRIRYLISGDRHRRSLRVWQTHDSRVCTDSAGENSSPTISNTTWTNHKGEGISHKVVCYREKGLSDHVRGRSTRIR